MLFYEACKKIGQFGSAVSYSYGDGKIVEGHINSVTRLGVSVVVEIEDHEDKTTHKVVDFNNICFIQEGE